jgi:hypothetical protein
MPGQVENVSMICSVVMRSTARGARTAIVRKRRPNWSALSSKKMTAPVKPADFMKSKAADAPVTSEFPETRPIMRIIIRGRLLTLRQLLLNVVTS